MAEKGIGKEDERQDRHDVAEAASGRFQHQDEQDAAGDRRPFSGNAQVCRQMAVFIAAHVDGCPHGKDTDNVDDPGENAEGFAAGKTVLEHVLIERHAQEQDRKGQCHVDAAFRNNAFDRVRDKAPACPEDLQDMVQSHTERYNDRDLPEDGVFALFEFLRRCQIGVQGIDINVLGFLFFDMLPPSRTRKYKTYLGVFLCQGKAVLTRP